MKKISLLILTIGLCLYFSCSSSSNVEEKILLAIDHFKMNPMNGPPDHATIAIELIVDSIQIITPKTKYSEEIKSNIFKICNSKKDEKGQFGKNWFEKKLIKLSKSFGDLLFTIDLDAKRRWYQQSKVKGGIAPIAAFVGNHLLKAHEQVKNYKYDDCLKSLLKIFPLLAPYS